MISFEKDFTSEVFISEKMLESQSGTQTLHQESSSMKVPQDENDIGKLKVKFHGPIKAWKSSIYRMHEF